jgi:hypothetical protein
MTTTVTQDVWLGSWGTWHDPEIATMDHFVYAIRTRFEPYKPENDDTAMNGIEFKTRDFQKWEDAGEYHPGSANWGRWGPWVRLGPDEYIVGMQVRYEDYQPDQDDTALNGLKIFIRTKGKIDTTEWLIEEGLWGTWKAPVYVPENHCVVGMQLRIEPYSSGNDDTALNGIRMISRPLHPDWRPAEGFISAEALERSKATHGKLLPENRPSKGIDRA